MGKRCGEGRGQLRQHFFGGSTSVVEKITTEGHLGWSLLFCRRLDLRLTNREADIALNDGL